MEREKENSKKEGMTFSFIWDFYYRYSNDGIYRTSKNYCLTLFKGMGYTTSDLMDMRLCVTLTTDYEMPIVKPTNIEIPTDIRSFHRVKRNMRKRDFIPHFYTDDNRIRRYMKNRYKTEEMLRNFNASISLDFSMTQEMSMSEKMYASFCNKLWAAWLQNLGHQVIPNVSFPYEVDEDFWIVGWPQNSLIAVSSVGVIRHGNPKVWLRGMERIRAVLKPTHILRYGSKIQGENEENCTYFDNDNNRLAKHGR